MFVGELEPAWPVKLHDTTVGLNSGNLEVRVDPEVQHDDFDLAEAHPSRINLAGSVLETVGGCVVRARSHWRQRVRHGVRGRLSDREPGAVSPLAIDRDLLKPPAFLQPGKIGDPLPACATRGLPVRDNSPSADDNGALVSRCRGVDGGALRGTRVLGFENQWLAQLVTTCVETNQDGFPRSRRSAEAADGITGTRDRGEGAVGTRRVRRGEGAGPGVTTLRIDLKRRRGHDLVVGTTDAGDQAERERETCQAVADAGSAETSHGTSSLDPIRISILSVVLTTRCDIHV